MSSSRSQNQWQQFGGQDFLQLTTEGGGVLGGIDSTGTGYGSLTGGGSGTVHTDATLSGNGAVATPLSVAPSVGMPQYGSYTFYVSGGVTYARNNHTGVIDASGTDAAVVINTAMANYAGTGAKLFFQNGVYNLNSVQTDPITGFAYCIGIPAATNNQFLSWHLEGESANEVAYSFLSGNGVIFNATSAAITAAGSGSLSVLYQLGSATFGNTNNNDCFFENICVRIPNNQRAHPTVLFDMFCALYASFLNCTADTTVIAGDQLGSNLPLAVSGITGFRTVQSDADECYMTNCWTVGMYYGYSVDTEHAILVNCHASCGYSPATYGAGNNYVEHPSVWIHFQDIHNVYGIVLGAKCGLGSRLDLINYDTEYAATGTYARLGNATESNVGYTSGRVTCTNVKATLGITNMNGPFFSTGGTNFQVEDSAKIYPMGQIYSTIASAATTGTSKQTLASFTLSAGPRGNDGSIFAGNPGATLRIKAWGITANNGNNKVVEIDFGGTTIATITSAANNGVVLIEADVVCGATGTQECIGKGQDGTVTNLTRTSPGITATAAIIIALAATTASGTGDFTFKGMTIEYLGGK